MPKPANRLRSPRASTHLPSHTPHGLVKVSSPAAKLHLDSGAFTNELC
jgi:hypothetical protein